ncbi:MAG: sigma-54-dependent Fis family transcriptional regulator [Deltaproteobacteria bacterium HGW-Deltaproteobacteria-14]|jgi:two-component system response regulator FlrC|nr:MAG: sigma-54-dependent Fis family transcriptional regulator [Deltaproteobacteria bacterium HGW-Deltaproteobacteria-14]
MARILVVDDEEGIRTFIGEVLEDEGHNVVLAADGQRALDALGKGSFHLMLTDLKMPRVDGMTLLRKARADYPEMEVIVLSAHGTVEGAVEAMKLGAFDYLQKPIASPTELRLLAERALERRGLKDQVERTLATDPGEERLSWGDPAMSSVVAALGKVARTDATVLLVGESGTGKEVAARAVHAQSKRSGGPFVAINCAALSDNLLESELFGHEKGAFTGALQRRRGRIELADGGTFFLDEVGELKQELQAKLLRVLQERTFERVGGSQALTADVRWVAATNRDLTAEMAAGRFREDLYHRLAVFPVRLPPLRERRADLLPLAEHLLVRVGQSLGKPGLSLDDSGRAALVGYDWPGNVRELLNALERAAILADGRVLSDEELILGTGSTAGATPDAGGTLATAEKTAILEALTAVGGHRKKAAERLGIGERTLYDKLKVYGIK